MGSVLAVGTGVLTPESSPGEVGEVLGREGRSPRAELAFVPRLGPRLSFWSPRCWVLCHHQAWFS